MLFAGGGTPGCRKQDPAFSVSALSFHSCQKRHDRPVSVQVFVLASSSSSNKTQTTELQNGTATTALKASTSPQIASPKRWSGASFQPRGDIMDAAEMEGKAEAPSIQLVGPLITIIYVTL
jgi:hypothetical protein